MLARVPTSEEQQATILVSPILCAIIIIMLRDGLTDKKIQETIKYSLQVLCKQLVA